MDEQPLLPETPAEPKRSQLLTVLCILSFIGSGLNAFSNLILAAFFDSFLVIAGELAKQFAWFDMEVLSATTPGFFLANGLLCVGSLIGAIIMWRLRKAGFHVYTIAQILLLITPMYFLKLPSPTLPELLISGTFVILYSSQLKLMR